jgi:hypothetical protein
MSEMIVCGSLFIRPLLEQSPIVERMRFTTVTKGEVVGRKVSRRET